MKPSNIPIPALIKTLMPENMNGNIKNHIRAALTVAVLSVNLFFCLLSVLYVEFFLSSVAPETVVYGRIVVFSAIVLYLAGAACLWFLKNVLAAGMFTLAGVFLSCSIGISITGGYTGSPITSLIALPAVFGFVLMGLRIGIVWAFITILGTITSCLLEIFGIYTPVQAIPNALITQTLALSVPIIGAIMVVSSLIFYELLTNRLQMELEKERNKYQWDATHDALTGLPNRPEFYHRLQLAIRNSEVSGQQLGLVFFDLDGFKPVNDRLGHHAGDIVLQVISQRLSAMVRNVDTVARLGGDEFAIILQGVSSNTSTLNGILTKILSAVNESIIIDGKEVSVGASLGVVFYSNEFTIDEFCKKADEAMYAAKKEKNTWRMAEA
ncbi:MAG: GGDEF domain-containing protein [Pseudomonadales bacterium]|nr:GGDEF domain-containing protein [Pseudomonadales bacterium]